MGENGIVGVGPLELFVVGEAVKFRLGDFFVFFENISYKLFFVLIGVPVVAIVKQHPEVATVEAVARFWEDDFGVELGFRDNWFGHRCCAYR